MWSSAYWNAAFWGAAFWASGVSGTPVVPVAPPGPVLSETYAAEHGRMYRTPVYQVVLRNSYTSSGHVFGTVFWDAWGRGGGNPILIPIDFFSQVELEQGRSPLSTFTFQLVDPLGSFTASHALADGIIGWISEFNQGYWDIAWDYTDTTPANNIRIATGIVTEAPASENGTYTITARSPMAAAQKAIIFAGAQTQLSTAINSALTTIPVKDASGFDGATPMDPKFALIDNEIITYTGRTATPGGVTSLDGVTRGQIADIMGVPTPVPYPIPPFIPDGQAAAHSDGAAVRELISLGRITGYGTGAVGPSNHSNGGVNDMHPVDHVRHILTSSSLKTGIGGAAALIPNDTELEYARSIIGPGVQFRYLDDVEISAKDRIEEICFDCACYPIEDADGKIGMKPFQSASDFSPIDTINDSHCLITPVWSDNAENLINMVVYHGDYNPASREYNTTFPPYRDPALIALHGRELPLHIWSKGIRSKFQEFLPGTKEWFGYTPTFIISASRRHLSRFGSSANILNVRTILQKNRLRVGDHVQGTFSNVFDRASGTSEITNRPFHIVGIKHDYRSNWIDIQLMEFTTYAAPFMVNPVYS